MSMAATQDHSESNNRPNLKRVSSQPLSPSSHPGPPPAPVQHHESVDSYLSNVAAITDEHGEGFRSTFNRANWQVTGVINNLPPRCTTPSSFQDLPHHNVPPRDQWTSITINTKVTPTNMTLMAPRVVRSRKYCGLYKQRVRASTETASIRL